MKASKRRPRLTQLQRLRLFRLVSRYEDVRVTLALAWRRVVGGAVCWLRGRHDVDEAHRLPGVVVCRCCVRVWTVGR